MAHDHIFAEQTWHDFYEPMRAIRTDRYKLIRNFEPGTGLQFAADILYTDAVDLMRAQLLRHSRPPFELYDLRTDPVERKNLVDHLDFSEVRRQLSAQLNDFLAFTGDPILDGVVSAPSGYFEHFMGKPQHPGGLPLHDRSQNWITISWPSGATQHNCGN